MSFGVWDALLIAVVSIMGTAIAYLRHPKHKAFVLMLPVPFTLAMLALAPPWPVLLAGLFLLRRKFLPWSCPSAVRPPRH